MVEIAHMESLRRISEVRLGFVRGEGEQPDPIDSITDQLNDIVRRLNRIESETIGTCTLGPAHDILSDVCRLRVIDRADLLGTSKLRELSHARSAIAYVVKTTLGWSTPRIANLLRRKNHTSILHSLSRADALRQSDPEFLALTDRAIFNHYLRIA